MVNYPIYLIIGCQGSHDDYHEDVLGYSFDGHHVMKILERLEVLREKIDIMYSEKNSFLEQLQDALSATYGYPTSETDDLELEESTKFIKKFELRWIEKVIDILSEEEKELISFFKILIDSDYYDIPHKFKYKEVVDIVTLTTPD